MVVTRLVTTVLCSISKNLYIMSIILQLLDEAEMSRHDSNGVYVEDDVAQAVLARRDSVDSDNNLDDETGICIRTRHA